MRLKCCCGWGIGSRDKNNGVLIVVATQDRQSRIEVGYGLEGALPDGLTGRLQDDTMLPYFKQGQYDKGIVNWLCLQRQQQLPKNTMLSWMA